MRLPLPRSLQGQTLAVLLLGLVLSHAVGVLIYSWDRGEAVASTEALDVTDRVSGVVSVLGKMPPEWRDDIVHAANSRTLRVFLVPGTGFRRAGRRAARRGNRQEPAGGLAGLAGISRRRGAERDAGLAPGKGGARPAGGIGAPIELPRRGPAAARRREYLGSAE